MTLYAVESGWWFPQEDQGTIEEGELGICLTHDFLKKIPINFLINL